MVKLYKEERIAVRRTEKVICNSCGAEIKKDASGEFYDYIEVSKQWGYLSGFDGQTHCFDLCEDCYKRFTEGFMHKPEIK